MQKERAERFMVRKRYFEESFGESALELPPPTDREKITRATLEEEARQSTLRTSSVEDRFWARQRSWEESAQIGAGLIEKMAPVENKKQQ